MNKISTNDKQQVVVYKCFYNQPFRLFVTPSSEVLAYIAKTLPLCVVLSLLLKGKCLNLQLITSVICLGLFKLLLL